MTFIALFPRQCKAMLLQGLIVGALITSANAQVITESFQNSTVSSGWVFGGSGYTPTLTSGVTDPVGQGWLQLTNTGGNEATSAYYDHAFTAAGATVYASFNYQSYGGTGADGITFFLFDGSVPFSVGAYGGSIGYAQKTVAGGGGANLNGLAGGYLGVALDEYGNFSSASEGRVGGLNGTTGLVPDSIAVRGPGSGLNGYAYLGGTNTLPQSIDSATRPTQTNTVQILVSATNQLTVTLQQGGTSPQTVLQMDLSGYSRPDTLKFGFASGTGGSTNYHLVNNLNVTTLTSNLWSGGAGETGDRLWASNANWDPTIVPTVGADILFDNSHVNSAQSIDTGANRTVRSISFDAPFDYTLKNNTITFDGGNVAGFSGIAVTQTHGAATNTIGSNLALANAINIRNNATGTLNLTGGIATNGKTITLDGTGTATNLSGVISGSGAIIKNDAGTDTLSGANTYSGGTTINGGVLNANHATALGSGGVTLAGGTLASTNGSSIGNAIALTGDATLSGIATTGTLTQTGSHILTLASATQSGAVNLSSGATAQTLTVQVDNGTSTLSGAIANGGTSSGGNLTKTGSGTLVLAGNNTYTGTTSVNAGVLQLGGSDRLADSSGLNLGASGTFNLNGNSEKIGTLTAAGGATLDFGAAGSANTFVFGTYNAPSSGVLVVNNWESGVDKLATTVAGQAVNSIYLSGYGVAQEAGSTSAMGGGYGNAYLLTPVATVYKEWDGSFTSNWSTSYNWTTNGAPSTTQIALFNSLGTGRPNVTFDATDTIAGIRFGPSANANYNITGSKTLTLAGTIPYIQQQSSYNQTLSPAALALSNNTVVDITGSGNLTIGAAISSSSNLIKDGTGSGKLILSGNSSGLTGNVYINNGIAQAAGTNALGTGTVTVADGATLELSGGVSPANALAITGSGVGGAGVVHNVSGTNTLSGTITAGGASTIAADSGTTLNLTGNLTGAGRDLTFAGAGNIAASRITTGTGAVTVNSTGTVTYNGGSTANTYTGDTTVNSGTLVLAKTGGTTAIAGNLAVNGGTVQLNAGNQIADTASVALAGSGTLNLNGQSETLGQLTSASSATTVALGAGALTLSGPNNSSSNYAGAITGAAGSSVTVNGSGKVYLTGNNSGFSGSTSVTNGTLNVSGSNNVLGSGAVSVSNAGNFQLQGGITLGNAVTINGTGTSGNGAIQNFAGTNTLSGSLTVAGSSRIESDAGTLTLGGNVGLGSSSLNVGGNANTNISGVISGSGGISKDGAGTLTLSASNTYTGATAVNAGTLVLGANNVLANTTAVSIAAGATFDVNGKTDTIGSLSGAGTLAIASGTLIAGNATNTTFSGSLTGNGTLTKQGSGVLTLSSNTSFGGDVNVTGGTLEFTATLPSIAGTLTLGAGSTLRLTGASLAVGTLHITGNTVLDFGGSSASILNATNFIIDAGVTLVSVTNWTNASDYFYAQGWSGSTLGTRGLGSETQVTFAGSSSSQTAWLSYDHQITPAPEPATYGAVLMGAALAVIGLRRRKARRAAQ
jgi:autotransporter-associated beta strand protein